jgi:putative ABC transport system substrate-binding protein
MLIVSVVVGFIAEPPAVQGQQPARIHRIGFLASSVCPSPSDANDRFRRVLREAGYVEGRNIVIECRAAGGQTDRFLDLAVELVRLKVDVLVAPSTPAALAAQRATTTIPIVISFVADAVASRLVTSLARPGANVTGLSIFGPEKTPKQLELLKEAAPRVSRVAILADLSNPGQVIELAHHDAVAPTLGLKTQVLDVRSAADLDATFATVLREGVQALFLAPLRIGPSDAERIMAFAIKNRLPTIGSVSSLYVPAGVLLFYTPNIAEHWQRAASYVDRILKGAKPADLPVEQPTKFDLIVNMKTAKALGLTIPPSLILRADQIVE